MSWLGSKDVLQLVVLVRLIGATEYGGVLDGPVQVGHVVVHLVLLLPTVEFLLLDHRLQVLINRTVLVQSILFQGFVHEVEFVNRILQRLNPKD